MTTRDLAPLISDTHMVLFRPDGRFLMLVRANTGYMDGHASLPAGHVEPGEPADAAAVRETKEETGVTVEPADVTFAHVMHRRTPGELAVRVSFFFTATRWTGEVVNGEPHKCSGLLWAEPDDLPASTVGYVADGIAAIGAGRGFSARGWH